MGLGMPSFDYNSLNAPGGIAQGLGAIGAAFVNARTQRERQAQQQAQLDFQRQGLAQVQAQNEFNNTYRTGQSTENERHNRAMEGIGATRASQVGVPHQKSPEELAYLQAQTAEAQARTERLGRPDRTRWDPSLPSADAQLKANSDAAAYADEQLALEARKPENKGTSGGMFPWSAGATPPKDLKAFREEAFQRRSSELRRGVGQFSTPASAAPNAVSNLRQRVSNAFGGQLDANVEAALRAAEAGDTEAQQQLEQHISGGAPTGNTVAPGSISGQDLLGNPTR